MTLDHKICYKAIKAQDHRFDGKFYTAVKTTGIYCRPICKVPAPKSENCTFYKTKVEAESNGYRPCLRCRPELAPTFNEFEQSGGIVGDILKFFESESYRPGLIKDAAEQFGLSSRHINRLFMETIGVSPQSYIRTHRLLSAKVLLTDTDMNVSDIALTVGYGSVSRFNAAFKEYYKLTPKQLRKKKDNKMNYFIVKLSYRPPYNWKVMMSFLKMRLVDKVEEVVGTSYRRTLEILHKKKSYVGWIQVSPNEDKHYLEVRVDNRLSAVLMQVIKQVKIAFDLDACLDSEFLTKDIRLPGCFNTFEMSVRAILGQQITVKAAHTLSGRLVRELGGELETPYENLTHVFPSAQVIASCDDIESVLGPLGIIKSRANAIYQIAKAMSQGALDFNEPYDKVYEYLIGLKGIGPWTAEYLSMRGSHWPDAFPVTDIGIKHAIYKDLVNEEGVKLTDMSLSKYKLDKEYQRLALIYAEKFRPFRSYLTISLWNQLGEN